MPRTRFVMVAAGTALIVASGALMGQAQQMPLAPAAAKGLTVTPAFEGWYANPDGTYTLSFGYYNRNREEVLEIPLGENNFIEPAAFDGDQPTHFQPRQHWGVFTVKVPADFGNRKVYWTLKIRGETMSIPGTLKVEWEIDALQGEAGSGNMPPVLKFDAAGAEGAGPAGITSGPLTATVGQPLTVNVWARDDGRPNTSVGSGGRQDVPVTLTWFKHQGPGDVTFSEETARIPVTGGQMTTTATFSEPGNYVIRVRANDASGVASAGHAQCCWTNGFVKVAVNQ